jgi:hypothetical protein
VSAIAFGDFVEHLRRHGYVVGLDHYARMMTVLERLGRESSPAQLKTMLCPIFATTAERQARFYQEFDRFYPLFQEQRASSRMGAVPEEASAPATQRRPWNRQVAWMSGAALAASLVVGVWFATRPEQAPLPTGPDIPTGALPNQPATLPDPITPFAPVVENPSFLERHRTKIRYGGILVLTLAFIAWEGIAYRRRRVLLERQRRAKPPLVWPVRVDRVTSPFLETPDFYTAARRLRDREAGDRLTLDVDATIAATVRAIGFPTMRYTAVTRPPEYLVLIERSSRQDHQASLYAQLANDLNGEGVHTAQYFYDDDPRACVPVEGGPAVTLSELRRKHSAHRLLVFGTGDGFIDPITGAPAPWAMDGLGWVDCVLLTPAIAARWGAREFTLASLFVVLPATVGGLLAAVDRIQDAERPVRRRSARITGGEFTADLTDAAWLPRLRDHLGHTAFQWVCACAVYPELQWRLTLFLGTLPELGARALDEESVLKVARLPWFRAGEIPDEARQALIRELAPGTERAVRMALIDLLERNPAPSESIASSGYELDLVVQKLVVDGPNRRRRRELLKAMRYAPRDRAVRELAVLRLAEGEPSSGLAMRLPSRLRSVFFRRGLPAFGLTTGARAAVMLLAQAALLVAVGRSIEPAKPPADPTFAKETPASVQAAGQPATPVASAPSANGERLLFGPPGVRLGVGDTGRFTAVVVGAAGDTLRRSIAFSARDAGIVTVLGGGEFVARAEGNTRVTAHSGDLTAFGIVLVEPQTRVLLYRGIRMHSQMEIVASRAILTDLLTPGRYKLTKAEEVEARKYLGGNHAIAEAFDSALVQFKAALALQPDLTLDSTAFTRVELSLFAAAKQTVAADAIPLPFPGGIQENLTRAKDLFNVNRFSEARAVLQQLLATGRDVSESQRVEMYKYMGAIHANNSDSARAYFLAAIDYDPFVELDRSIFAADEQAAFARARASISKIGVRLAQPVILIQVPTPIVRIVTTRPSRVRVELRSLGDAQLQEILFASDVSDGIRDIVWNGLINTRRPDSGQYFIRVVASNVAARWSDSSTVTFGVVCDSGRALKCAAGSTDFATLRSVLDDPAAASPAAPVAVPIEDWLRQAKTAFENLNYSGAAGLARQVWPRPEASREQKVRAIQIAVAGLYPAEKASQIPDLAVVMIRDWAALAGPNATFPRELSWPGLDSLIVEVLRPKPSAALRPATQLVDSLARLFAGDWKTPAKVPHVEFSSPAATSAFANQLRNFQTRGEITAFNPEASRGDTVSYLATARFQWRDAFGVQRTKSARVRWVLVCQGGLANCDVKRVVFLDPVP